MNKYNKKKYKKDFPDEGAFNWKKVKLITPENIYYNNHELIGVVLHDGNFMINGVLFLSNQFKIIDENPSNLSKK